MKLTVGKKLALGFGVVLVLMIASTTIVYLKARHVNEIRLIITTMRVPSVIALEDLQRDLNQAGSKARQAVLSANNKEHFDKAKSLFDDQSQLIEKDFARLDELSPHWTVQANRDRLTALKSRVHDFIALEQNGMAMATKGQPASIVQAGDFLNEKALALNAGIQQTLSELAQSHQEHMKSDQEQANSEGETMLRVMWISTLAAFAIGIFVAALLGRKISGATAAALERAEAIAEGDLTGMELVATSQDELGELTLAINKMQASLREVVDSILTSTEHLASASEEISASATEQSAGMESQKDQTHQVATAMQEMSSTVVQISDNSTKAADAAQKASKTAREGGKIVEETLRKMREIAASVGETAKQVNGLGARSDQIGQIIGVIDDIADQTNLLALNAAIEAARAGEQGRGFAVVADEVRKLAERTSKATKEIAQMIQSIQEETKSAVVAMESGTKQVEAGVDMTTQAGSSLHGIIQSAEQVGEMVTHIATAATEQSSATEEVNTNIEQIAKITAETSEGAQQSAKACHDLSSLALDLQNIVSKFKIGANGTSRKPSARVKARPGSVRSFKTDRRREEESAELIAR